MVFVISTICLVKADVVVVNSTMLNTMISIKKRKKNSTYPWYTTWLPVCLVLFFLIPSVIAAESAGIIAGIWSWLIKNKEIITLIAIAAMLSAFAWMCFRENRNKFKNMSAQVDLNTSSKVSYKKRKESPRKDALLSQTSRPTQIRRQQRERRPQTQQQRAIQIECSDSDESIEIWL